MKNDEYKTIIDMLLAQLGEEEDMYREAIKENKAFSLLKEIQQRMKSLRCTLDCLQKKNAPVAQLKHE